jgi:uncharacterized lipoprotein YmbA
MFRYLLIVSLMLCLSACGTSPKTSFYVLNSDIKLPAQEDKGLGIGVWKVKLPVLIDRPEMVTREGQYVIELADFHQWAGGLDNNITSLIALELSLRLETGRIAVSPWRTSTKNDYQVKVFINRFDGELGGEVVFRGIWVLSDGEGDKELIREVFTLGAKANGKSHKDMAVTLSKLVVQLTDTIADRITAQDQSKSH